LAISWRPEPESAATRALIELARKAAASAPQRPANWATLTSLLASAGRDDEAAAAALDGVSHCPASAELRYLAAQKLRVLRRFEEALERTEETLELDGDHATARRLRFALEVQAKHVSAAREHLAEAAAIDPCEPYIFEFLGKRLGEDGVVDELLKRCAAALAINPACANAVFFKALALAKLGRTEEASAVLSLDRLVHISEPAAPPAFPDRAAFLTDLAEAIRAHPTLRQNPAGKATMGGMQTGPLHQQDGPAVAAAIDLIQAAVASYADSQSLAGHSFAATVPEACALDVWAVVLGPEGRQRPHRHPRGWVSGVFYVQAPKRTTTAAYSGALAIGEINDKFGVTPPWGIREIEPVPGRLVLFPSYTPHGTRPSGAAGERISIAFDVIPTR
jgi:tetratricopeptide (TPR) repeat protein